MKRIIAATLLIFLMAGASAIADSLDTPSATTAAPSDSFSQQASTDKGGTLQYPLSPERQAQLKSYARFVNIWRFAEFFISIGLLALLLFSGLSARFRTWAQSVRQRFLVCWLYLAIFVVAFFLLDLPISYYREFVVE